MFIRFIEKTHVPQGSDMERIHNGVMDSFYVNSEHPVMKSGRTSSRKVRDGGTKNKAGDQRSEETLIT